MPARKQNCVWLYLKINKSTCINQKLARMPCEMLITWKRYADMLEWNNTTNAWVALHWAALHGLHCMGLHCMGLHCMGLHYVGLHCMGLHCMGLHCMGLHCMGLHCTAWNCTAYRVALHGVALHGAALHGVALHGAVLHGTALHGAALHGLHCINCMFFCLGGGGGKAIPLSLGRACLIKPQFIITVFCALIAE